MFRKIALTFIVFATLLATAHAAQNDVTISNASNTVVILNCTNCTDCSPVIVMPMGKVLLDCVPSNVKDALTLQYTYTRSNKETMEGKINLSLGQNLTIENGDNALNFLLSVSDFVTSQAHAEEASATTTPCTEKGFCQDDCTKIDECSSLIAGIQCWLIGVDLPESAVKIDECNDLLTGTECWLCPDTDY